MKWNKMKIRVKKNIGGDSEFVFGKPGTVLNFDTNTIESVETDLYSSHHILRLSPKREIYTLKDLNDYMLHEERPHYKTLFEEVDTKIEGELFSSMITFLKEMEELKDRFTTRIKIRVKENIGRKSKEIFGERGTLLIIEGDMIKSKRTFKNSSVPKHYIHLKDAIEVSTDFFDNKKYSLLPCYQTIFEEIEGGIEITLKRENDNEK